MANKRIEQWRYCVSIMTNQDAVCLFREEYFLFDPSNAMLWFFSNNKSVCGTFTRDICPPSYIPLTCGGGGSEVRWVDKNSCCFSVSIVPGNNQDDKYLLVLKAKSQVDAQKWHDSLSSFICTTCTTDAPCTTCTTCTTDVPCTTCTTCTTGRQVKGCWDNADNALLLDLEEDICRSERVSCRRHVDALQSYQHVEKLLTNRSFNQSIVYSIFDYIFVCLFI